MPIPLTVTAGYTYADDDTVDFGDLNKLGNPTVSLPDGKDADFAKISLGAGTVGTPALAPAAELTSGMYRPGAGEIGWSILGNAIVKLTANGVEMATGKTFRGKMEPLAGTVGAPGIVFQGTTLGICADGGGVSVVDGGTQILALTTTSGRFFADLKVDDDLEVVGDVTIGGKCTVTGLLSGTIAGIADGTESAPGLSLATDTKSGLFKPPISGGQRGLALGVGGQTAIEMLSGSEGGDPVTVLTNGANIGWYSAMSDFSMVLGGGSAGARAAFWAIAPKVTAVTGTTIQMKNRPLGYVGDETWEWMCAKLDTYKVVIPCLRYDW